MHISLDAGRLIRAQRKKSATSLHLKVAGKSAETHMEKGRYLVVFLMKPASQLEIQPK